MNEQMIATSGCFDIITAGHIELFREMALHKPSVVVFLNSDESVRRLKGPGRPLVTQALRKMVLESIRYVHRVEIFTEDRPHKIIREYEPAIWAKGGDYDIEKMQSTPIVRAYGGRVMIIPIKTDWHTSDIIRRCQKLEVQSE